MLKARSPFTMRFRRINIPAVLLVCVLLTACGPELVAAPIASPSPTLNPTATLEPTATPPPSATPMPSATPTSSPTPTPTVTPTAAPASADVIRSRSNVPILCYHQVRDWAPDEADADKSYIVPVKVFANQMDWLDHNGFHTITPDQLYDNLTTGAPLPSKPILLTFDDGHHSEWANALPILQQHHFLATFFIMTVTLDKPHYLSTDEIKQLDRMGMTIAAHTWDHHRVTRYTESDWRLQIDEPTKQLAEMTGHPIRYFAYPYGLWNPDAFPHLKSAGFVAAFQLSERMDRTQPLYTIRRIIASGTWGIDEFQSGIEQDF